MSQDATHEDFAVANVNRSEGMSDEEVKSLWRDVTEIKASLKLMDQNIRESFAKLSCSEMRERIAKSEQRLDNGSSQSNSNRAWIAVMLSFLGMLVGWIFTIIKLKG